MVVNMTIPTELGFRTPAILKEKIHFGLVLV